MKKNKGMTLLELVIVISLIAILSAIIVPNFTSSTAKAKLTSDLQSAKIIQNAIDMYNAEQDSTITGSDINSIITELHNEDYIKQPTYKPQTPDALFVYDNTKNIVVVDLTAVTDPKTLDAVDNISENDKYYIKLS